MTGTLPPLTSAELSDLKAKAKAATPGRWHRHRQGEITKGNYILANVNNPIRHGDKRDAAEFSNNLAHIAAANPETIQRLIDMIERRDGVLKKLEEALIAGGSELMSNRQRLINLVREALAEAEQK